MKTRKKGLWVLPLAALLAGIFFLSFLIGRYRVPALQVLRQALQARLTHWFDCYVDPALDGSREDVRGGGQLTSHSFK